MSYQVHLNAKPAATDLPPTTYRLSTKHLNISNCILKTAAFYVAYSQNPTQALSGALCGAVLRVIAAYRGDRIETPERTYRAQQTASMCLTASAAAYAGCTPGPHSVTPFLLGLEAASDGLYPLLRRAMD